MAWQSSSPKGIDDWLQRLRENDSTLTSIAVFKNRKFGAEASSVNFRRQTSSKQD